MRRLPDGMHDPKWWLWLCVLVLVYCFAALAGCHVGQGAR